MSKEGEGTRDKLRNQKYTITVVPTDKNGEIVVDTCEVEMKISKTGDELDLTKTDNRAILDSAYNHNSVILIKPIK